MLPWKLVFPVDAFGKQQTNCMPTCNVQRLLYSRYFIISMVISSLLLRFYRNGVYGFCVFPNSSK